MIRYQHDKAIFFCRGLAPVMKTLARGSMLRISADVTGGLPLDHWKTRSIRHPSEGPFEALCNVYRQQGGVKAFWAGLPAKLIEGSLCGGLLLVGKEGCKTTLTRAVTRMRLPVGEAAIGAVAGVAGGVAQCAVLTPSTFLVMTAATTGCSVMETVSKIARGERKFTDLYTGGGGLVMREATNWASRQGITDFTRNFLRRQGLPAGVALEIGSGVFGGVLACWNNPFEVARVRQQRDLALAKAKQAQGQNTRPPPTSRVLALDGSMITVLAAHKQARTLARTIHVIKFVCPLHTNRAPSPPQPPATSPALQPPSFSPIRTRAQVPPPNSSPFDVIRYVIATEGVQGLFIGIVPRCIVSAHLTVFMVVAPRLLGM
jgi:hypothetical protein